MVDEQDDVTSKSTPPVNIRHVHKFIFGYIALIILAAALGGIYSWQHEKVVNLNTQLSSANAEINSLKKEVSETSQKTSTTPARVQPSTFTYTPKTGGFSLTLPKTYEVLVGADGNDGGAPGFDFKVVSLSDTNISTDESYTDEVEVQTWGNQSLADVVSGEEAEMQQDGDCSIVSGSCDTTDFGVSDAIIGGQPAKLITAKAGSEYQGYVDAYVVVYGNWGYVITSNNVTSSGSSNNIPGTLLSAVLNGISLKVAAPE